MSAVAAPFAVGDRVYIAEAPLILVVAAVGVCTEDGCQKPTISFTDPGTGEPDTAHADEFKLAE